MTAQLEQRLGATQIELRKLSSERHTLRSRLRREVDRVRELESALRAEKELHAQASDEHFGAIVGLRVRMAEIEAEREEARRERSQAQESLTLSQGQLDDERAQLEAARAQLEEARAQLELARGVRGDTRGSGSLRAAKSPQGLRRIRGIGPAYERVLEGFGVTRVQQVAAWTEQDIRAFAEKLKIKPERISKEDWVGQAEKLEPDPEGDSARTGSG